MLTLLIPSDISIDRGKLFLRQEVVIPLGAIMRENSRKNAT